MSLLFNMLSRLVITFLPRSKSLFISWLQSPSAVILEPKKIKSLTVSIVSPSICHEVMGPDAMILVVWMLSLKPTFSLSSLHFIKRLFSSPLLSAQPLCLLLNPYLTPKAPEMLPNGCLVLPALDYFWANRKLYFTYDKRESQTSISTQEAEAGGGPRMGPLTTPCICTPQASCLLLVKLRSVFFFFQLYKYHMFVGKKKSKSYTDEQREEIVLFLSPKENHCNPLVCVLTDVCVWTCVCVVQARRKGAKTENK